MSAVAVITTGGTRVSHMTMEPYTVEYQSQFLFPNTRPRCAFDSLPPVLAFLYVFVHFS